MEGSIMTNKNSDAHATAETEGSGEDRLTQDALEYLVGMNWQRQPETFARSLAIRQFLEEHVEAIRERANAIMVTGRNALRSIDRPSARDDE
jgi:hypothetical protein